MAYYFKHDDNARHDPKLIRLRRIKGMKGIGIYWCLIEILHEQGGKITYEEVGSIAFELQEDENNILSVINEFELFVIRGYEIGNTRVLQSLEERAKNSKVARANVQKRWNKQRIGNKEDNTPVLPKTYDGNTIREENIREEYIHPINDFIKKECKNVSTLKQQLTKDQCENLLAKYPKDAVKRVLNAMDNKKDLNRKYVSVYKTLINWLLRDGITENTDKKPIKPSYLQGTL